MITEIRFQGQGWWWCQVHVFRMNGIEYRFGIRNKDGAGYLGTIANQSNDPSKVLWMPVALPFPSYPLRRVDEDPEQYLTKMMKLSILRG